MSLLDVQGFAIARIEPTPEKLKQPLQLEKPSASVAGYGALNKGE
jgi:hypothetical protein